MMYNVVKTRIARHSGYTSDSKPKYLYKAVGLTYNWLNSTIFVFELTNIPSFLLEREGSSALELVRDY
jgi:hypothetical protein